MIEYVSDDTRPAWEGYLYGVAIFVLAVLRTVLLHQYFHRCNIVGMRIRSGLIFAVYRKVWYISVTNSLLCSGYVL